MEPTEVTVRFNIDGGFQPVSFTWKGVSHRIESSGRRWRDDQGYHVLVMAAGARVFELNFDPGELRWSVRPTGAERNAA